MGKAAIVSTSIVFVTLLNAWFIFFFYSPHVHHRTQSDSARPPSSISISSSSISSISSSSSIGSSSRTSSARNSSARNSSSKNTSKEGVGLETGDWKCDIFGGRWEYQQRSVLYNETCKYIQPSQNCFQNGRPDREFLNWKWRPKNCQLPMLDPAAFLESMKGKKMVFIGDSIARNHMQSLLCALAQVEEPEKIYFDSKDKEMKWGFPAHKFTLANLWAPFLVESTFHDEVHRLQLDLPDTVWASQLDDFDVAIISCGYWYFRPSIYYLNKRMLGCNPRSHLNCTIFEVLPAYRLAHEQMLKYMSEKFRGITFLRTITVDHFEHGSWDTGGVCNRTGPYSDPETQLPWMSNEMFKIQLEEFDKALKYGKGSGTSKLKLLNVTYSTFLRPDGHPGLFRIQEPTERPQNDCLHWCLPGPIDTWNEMLSYALRH